MYLGNLKESAVLGTFEHLKLEPLLRRKTFIEKDKHSEDRTKDFDETKGGSYYREAEIWEISKKNIQEKSQY